MASSSNDSPSFNKGSCPIWDTSSPSWSSEASRFVLCRVLLVVTIFLDPYLLMKWLFRYLYCQSADIDEKAIRREELVKALAEAKADAVKLNLADGCGGDQPTLLITSDQVMVSKGVIRERPRSAEEAREFIKAYSGDRALAVNYVLVTNLSTGARKGGWDIPEIIFRHIPDAFIEEILKEEGMTCVAGGLKLTHPSVSPFIEELIGTADSVRGLPRELTEQLIRESLEAK